MQNNFYSKLYFTFWAWSDYRFVMFFEATDGRLKDFILLKQESGSSAQGSKAGGLKA